MKKVRAAYALLSALFLVMGMCIYLLFRDLDNLVLFAWIPKPEFAGSALVQLSPSALSNVLKYNSAGMLWFVSGILFFRFAWFHRAKEQKVYIGCFYAVGGIIEICQLSQRVPGTFDLLDLVFMGIGAFGEGLLYNTFVKRKMV
ncbi:MAG: hypothetical protein FWB78_07955 [Treponema sp.]|nr:hypothetical protein [Treponema sp.]